MSIPRRVHLLAYGLAFGLPAVALGVAALAHARIGPSCVELSDELAGPNLALLEAEAPNPACIRVKLAELR